MKFRVTEIISFSLIVIITTSVTVACNGKVVQEQSVTTGVHSWVEPTWAEDIGQFKITIINNTTEPIQPSADIGADQWRIFRKTEMGWQEFFHKLSPRALFAVEDIDQWMPPHQRNTYDIRELLYNSYTMDPLQPPAELPKFPGLEVNEGSYIIEIHYRSQTSEGIIPLLTYTPVFTYKQISASAEEVKIAITPKLRKQQTENVVTFEVVNQSQQQIWIIPIDLPKYYPFGPVPLTLMRKVDDTSWELVQEDWPNLGHAPEPIEVKANEGRSLSTADINAGLRIDAPGVYRFIIPVFLEYYPDGVEGHLPSDLNSNPRAFNQPRFIFTEEFRIE